AAHGGQRLERFTFGIEVRRTEIDKKKIGIVAARAIAVRGRRLHLRIEPISERGKASEQQHGRPGDQSIDECAGAIHVGEASGSRPCALRMSSANSRTAPKPPSRAVT